ncbi:MAG: hypothetical protein Tsb0032_15830 [Kiloniellaceae bacterium]
MQFSSREDFEFTQGVRIHRQAWDCDIVSVMADRLEKYQEIANCKLTPEYSQPRRERLSLCDLLRRDLDAFAQHIPEVAALRDRIEVFQFDGNTPDATILLPAETDGQAAIGVSSAFIKFLHLYLSKFMTLQQPHREGNIHDDFLEEVRGEKWACLPVYLSLIKDAATYHRLDYDREIENYRYLYQPYEYCDLVIAARQFALLHEVAHLHIRLTQGPDALNPHGEEYFADELAYLWLVQPFTAKESLSEEETYDLSMRVQAPFHYFAACNMPFALHHWDADKVAVLREKKRDYYRLHPLRREMSLFASLRHQPVFERHPVMARYVYGYIEREHIAHDPETFFRHELGPFGLLGLTDDNPDLDRAMKALIISVADAYRTYSQLDHFVAYEHGLTLGWLHQRMLKIYRDGPEGEGQDPADLFAAIDRIIRRRMGLTKNSGWLKRVSAEHEMVFGQTPGSAYHTANRGWKRWFGVMQIDSQVVAEASREEVEAAAAQAEDLRAKTRDFRETRNLDGGAPLMLFDLSVDFLVGTSAGVFAAWLYDLLKTVRAKRLRVEGEEIPVTKEDLEKILRALQERDSGRSAG